MRLSDILKESIDAAVIAVDDIIFSFIAANKQKLSVSKLRKQLSVSGINVDTDILLKILDDNEKIMSVVGDVATVVNEQPTPQEDSDELVSQMAQQSI